MSDELRKAAERIVAGDFGEAIDRPRWLEKAVVELARAYLRENPADDDARDMLVDAATQMLDEIEHRRGIRL